MYCNYRAPDLVAQIGQQPISVNYVYLNNIFYNIREELAKEKVECGTVTLTFVDEKEKIKGPSAIMHSIVFDETFLSFLWCACYGLVTLTPDKDREITPEARERSMSLIAYALSLFQNYSEWDIFNTPNPELAQKEDVEAVDKTNMCYAIAMNFIVYHEFAHIYYNDAASTLETEKRADLFALERVKKFYESDPDFVLTTILGALSALSTITFTTSIMKGGTHPDPDHRMTYCLENLNFPENHFSWYFATWSFLLWQMVQKKFWLAAEAKYENGKQFYYNVLAGLKTWKEGTNPWSRPTDFA